jgi:predicted porin
MRSPLIYKIKPRLLVGVSLLTLFASHAYAQPTSVTLYGRVDLNLTKISDASLAMSQASTSRFGFRGTEALGGGWNTLFQLEAAVEADTGQGGSALFGRESWLGVSKKEFGTLRLGRTLTPSQRVASNYDPHGTDGIGSFGSGGLLLTQSALARFNNGIYYETPNWGGFSVFAGHQLDEVKDSTDSSISSIRVRYQSGGLDTSLAYANLSKGNKVTSLGLSYDFKVVKPMFQFHSGQRNGIDRRHWLIGATAPLGAGNARVAYSKQDIRPAGRADRSLISAGYDYPLSKRTMLYGTYARDKTSGVKASNGIELGIRHNF